MKKISRKKKGFTLVEMVLVLAITVMLGGIIAGVCAAISNSFITTYNIDDSADYAMLYAKGFENSFLTYSQATWESKAYWKWEIVNPSGAPGTVPTLTAYAGSTAAGTGTTAYAVFDPTNLMTSPPSSKSKWAISMFYKYDPENCYVNYRIFVKDNYSNTNYVTRYDGGFWLPRFEDCAKYDNVEGTRTVEINGESLTAATLKSAKYGFTDDDVAQIANGIDPTYKDTIVFYYG